MIHLVASGLHLKSQKGKLLTGDDTGLSSPVQFHIIQKTLILENCANHFYMRIEIYRNLNELISKHGDIAVL